MSAGTGSAIRAMRRAMGLTQRDLARLAGASRTYLSGVENGREPSQAWSWSMSTTLAEYLSVCASQKVVQA